MKESGSIGRGVSMSAGRGIGRSIGSVGTISRGPSKEGRLGFSARALSIPSSRIANPGLKVTSYINPNSRRNEAFAPYGLPKSPEKGLRPTSITPQSHLEKSVLKIQSNESKRTEAFLPSDQVTDIYRSPKTERSHRRRPSRSFHQEIPNIKHNQNYEIKKPESPSAPVIERIPTYIKKFQPELFTPHHTLLKKAEGTTLQVLDKIPSHELRARPATVQRTELTNTKLRLAMLRQIRTVTNRRAQLKPGFDLETSTALKTQTNLLRFTELQNNTELPTVTELSAPVAKRARPDQLTDEEENQIKEIVLYQMKKAPDKSENKEEEESPRLDRDNKANDARKERITKAIKGAINQAKNKDEILTGKDIAQILPKKPTDDVLSELAKEFGLEHDGSWSAILYAMRAVQKVDHKINKFIKSAIDMFTAVRRRKRPAQPATKQNAKLVVMGGAPIEEDTFVSRLVA